MADDERRQLLALVAVVLVSIVAISMAAATIDNVTGTGDQGASDPRLENFGADQSGTTDSEEKNGSDGGFEFSGNESSGEELSLSGCNDFLDSRPGTLVYFGAVLGIIYLFKRRFSMGFALLGAYAVSPVALAVYFLRTQCVEQGPGIGRAGDRVLGNGTDQAPVESFNLPPALMVGLFAVLFVGVAAVIFVSTGSREYEPEAESEEREEPDVEEIAAAAGAAADRLESRNADVDNEVYRAWWDMTQLLNVSSPETFTPGEFAEVATDLGIDEEHVGSLTTLFEEVRYGHRDAESREDRAIEIFREIEQYGDGGAGTSVETGTDNTDESDGGDEA